MGTRFLPATKAVAKEMLPIIDVPTIQHVVQEAADAGITDIFIITARNKRSISEHFGRNEDLERTLQDRKAADMLEVLRGIDNLGNIHFIRQEKPKGLGHAVHCARRHIGDEPFAVLLGDNVIDAAVPAVGQLAKVYDKLGRSIVAVEEVPIEKVSRYGIVHGRKVGERTFEVETLVEKPRAEQAPSNLAIAARYILTPGIFEALDRTGRSHGGEIQLTDALRILKDTEPLYAHVIEGRRLDTGDKLEYLKTQVLYGLKRKEFAASFLDFLRELVRTRDEA
jgi:UTP--glucose-1-phosphate uridylyltransferase